MELGRIRVELVRTTCVAHHALRHLAAVEPLRAVVVRRVANVGDDAHGGAGRGPLGGHAAADDGDLRAILTHEVVCLRSLAAVRHLAQVLCVEVVDWHPPAVTAGRRKLKRLSRGLFESVT